ncbi:RxLR effector protein [Phytophthora megakarya]|uniref:RxLR effector protein n=1 Tax=Phytophthora megakarya TaxID=4795 RepID=A0A225VE58_9STRA|nr:RxLR effector protein [Phytophthora megakarya]
MGVKTLSYTNQYRKEILVVMLLACVTMVSAVPASNEAASSSLTSEILNMGDTDNFQRFLRTETNTATDEHTNTFQKRMLVISLPSLEILGPNIKTGLSSLMEKLNLQWWQLQGKSVDDVFTALKLNQAGDKLFESPVFSQWVAFVTLHGNDYLDLNIFTTLTKHYDDAVLAKMIVASREVDDTRALAAKLEQYQLRTWLARGKTADEAFKSLQLDQAGAKLFESPVFGYWDSFVAQQKSRHPDTVMLSVLGKYHNDDAIAQMVVAAKEVSGTKDIATTVERLQMTNWLTAGDTADDVFKVLKLDQAGDKLLENPVFGYWASFVALRNREHPDTMTNWLIAGKSPDDVFKILKLEQVGDKLLDSSLFRVWATFVAKINAENKNKVIVEQLINSFDDVPLARMTSEATKVDPSMEKLIAQLEYAQFSLWRGQRKTPQEVAMMLRGTTNADGMLRNYKKFVKIDN